jgi:predicted glycosyltransferase
MTRVAFLVCHLTGSGHLTRTVALARGVAAAGGEAVVISGGAPLPHLDARFVRLVQLPPVAVPDFDYATLRGPDGAPVSAGRLAERRTMLSDTLRDLRPDVLVAELFPFGRRALAGEFEMAFAIAADSGARIMTSVRDIPEPPGKPGRLAETETRLRRWNIRVLAHGDPRVAPFALGWPGAAAIDDLIRHTGYVAEPLPEPLGDPAEVLAAVGGGVLGRAVLPVAVAAARLGSRRWRIRVGGPDAAEVIARLRAGAEGAPVAIEPAAADYRARLRTAAASVSLFGYNTAVDLLQTGVPAVVAPMAEAGEQEQALRARAFARHDQFTFLDTRVLTPETLAAAVSAAIARGRGPACAVDLAGVATSARLILGT